MSGAQRCDEILRLIDETLADYEREPSRDSAEEYALPGVKS
jgi:hypothetical protein